MDDLIGMLAKPAHRIGLEARSLAALVRAGMVGVEPPHKLLRIISAVNDFGPMGAAPRIAALRHGDLPAIADERGELTFRELDDQVNRLCNALRAQGLGAGSSLGVLCSNHRSPLIAGFAASRMGMSAIWLNTAFSARQAKEVAEREGVELLVYDEALAEIAAGVEPDHGKVVTATGDPAADEFEQLITAGDPASPPAPGRPGKVVLLTSGTTGVPKGAPRTEPRGFTLPGAMLERMPLRAREACLIGPPLFHGTGLSVALLSISLGSKLVLRSKFDAARFLDDSAAHGATTWCVVPIMLQRILALGEDEIRRHDLSRLRVVFCGGSQLPAEIAVRATNVLGDVIYNLYGTTEVSLATMATPADVRAAPTSVGKPMLGAKVALFDDNGKAVAKGGTGRIFVGTTSPFEGYTGGGAKEVIEGLTATGDVGHFDDEGRLYVDGRDDEMIVSGGENVFPREVEELLLTHPAISDVAVIGVEDAEFGQRLKAFIVSGTACLTAKEAQQFVKDNLARFKVPREVIFVDDLPRNPSGKLLKRELAALKD